MILSNLIDEDFTMYKKPAMIIGFPHCDMKCGSMCQNVVLLDSERVDVAVIALVDRYMNNPITHAIVFAGLEPFNTYDMMVDLIKAIRERTCDDIVIYTGYAKEEIMHDVDNLREYKNIIVKYGRYIEGDKPHYNELLGIELASSNQWAEKIC